MAHRLAAFDHWLLTMITDHHFQLVSKPMTGDDRLTDLHNPN